MREKKKTPMRQAREKAGLTLEKVAIATGIPFSTVQGFEAGRGATWSMERKKKIAAFLAVPFSSLWPEEKEKIEQAKKFYATITKASK